MNDSKVSEINSVLQECIEQGFNGPEVAEAEALVTKLSLLDGSREDLAAALKVLEVKAKSYAGVADGDWKPLEDVIATATKTAEGTDLPFPELEDAKVWLERYKQHPEAKNKLIAAVEEDNRLKLKEAVDLAENVGMEGELLQNAQARLRELQIAFRDEQVAKGESVEEAADYDEAEEKREQRKEEARQQKYEFKNFHNLRSPDDYARGIIWNKSNVKKGFLLFNEDQIPKSLTKLEPKLNNVAVLMNQNILGYCGDKQMNIPLCWLRISLRRVLRIKL